MTESQTLRAEGIAASLAERGVTLRRQSTGDEFLGMVEMLDASSPSYDVSKDEQDQSLLHVPRSGFTGTPVRPGEVFIQLDTGTRHRVFKVSDAPMNLLLRWWATSVTEASP